MEYKYLTVFVIPPPFHWPIIDLMNKVATMTGLPAPHIKLPPHVSLHKPVTVYKESHLINDISYITRRSSRTGIRLCRLTFFGGRFIVLPVAPTKSFAKLWIDICGVVSDPDGRGRTDYENTLHVTIAEETSEIFDRIWPGVRKFEESILVPQLVPVQSINLYRKPIEGGRWEKVEEFLIPV